MKLATVRIAKPELSERRERIEKPSLLNSKFQYHPAAAHSDPGYMKSRMDFYKQREKK